MAITYQPPYDSDEDIVAAKKAGDRHAEEHPALAKTFRWAALRVLPSGGQFEVVAISMDGAQAGQGSLILAPTHGAAARWAQEMQQTLNLA